MAKLIVKLLLTKGQHNTNAIIFRDLLNQEFRRVEERWLTKRWMPTMDDIINDIRKERNNHDFCEELHWEVIM
jgi:hypothetical protein